MENREPHKRQISLGRRLPLMMIIGPADVRERVGLDSLPGVAPYLSEVLTRGNASMIAHLHPTAIRRIGCGLV